MPVRLRQIEAPEPLAIDYRPIASLIPYARNARTHSEAQVALIAGSIREYGFTNPVLVDGENGIIAGHGRVLAARKLGLASVPVIELGAPQRGAEARLHPRRQPARRAGRLGPRAARAGARRAGGARHRPRRARLRGGRARCAARQRRCPTRARRRHPSRRRCRFPGTATSGSSAPHRLLCGSSTDAADVARLLGRVRPHLMASRSAVRRELRPGLAQQGRAVGDEAHRQGAERRPGRLARGLGAVPRRGRLRLARRAARHHRRREPGGLRLRHPQPDHLGQGAAGALAAATTTGSTSPAGTRSARRRKGHWNGDRKQTTLWQIPSRDQDAKTVHGTQKPVECMRRPMLNNSSPGQAVYEPFSGSGTTHHRRRDLRPHLALDGARPGLRRCRGAALAGLHRARPRPSTATAAASPRSPPSAATSPMRARP